MRSSHPTTFVLGSCVATVKIPGISGWYSKQVQGRDPRGLIANQQQQQTAFSIGF